MPHTIYVPSDVRILRETFPRLKGDYSDMQSISDLYNYIKDNLILNYDDYREIVEMLYRHHYPNYFKQKPEIAIDTNFDLVIARSIGFDDYEHYISNSTLGFNKNLQKAILLVLNGEETELVDLLNSHKELLFQNCMLGHRARLIDYLSSNGVEFWRQIVPANADKILEKICSLNFDKFVTNNIYGGNTVRSLIESSAHPKAAKIEYRLLEVLSKYNL